MLVLQVLERQDDAGGVETRVAFGDGAADAGQVVKELAAITVSMHMYCKQNKTRRQSNRPYEKKKINAPKSAGPEKSRRAGPKKGYRSPS